MEAILLKIRKCLAEKSFIEYAEEIFPEEVGLIYYIEARIEIVGCFYDGENVVILLCFKEAPTIHENVWEGFLDLVSDIKDRLRECASQLDIAKVKVVLYEEYSQIEEGAIADFYLS